jgi:hypothetical protein
MILGNKSDLKKHLSVKRPTWAHKVVTHSPLEHNMGMERREESTPDRDTAPRADRSEPMEPQR